MYKNRPQQYMHGQPLHQVLLRISSPYALEQTACMHWEQDCETLNREYICAACYGTVLYQATFLAPPCEGVRYIWGWSALFVDISACHTTFPSLLSPIMLSFLR